MDELPLVLLVLALGLTLMPFLSIFLQTQEMNVGRPTIAVMVASAVSPVALALCFLSKPPTTGLLLVLTGVVLSFLVEDRLPRVLLVSLGALSMALYFQMFTQPL